jgi:hypothetical protein
VRLEDYLEIDQEAQLVLRPLGENSCVMSPGEFARNRALYAHVARALAGFAGWMNPSPSTDSEVVARTVILFRAEGFFSTRKPIEEVVGMIPGIVLDLCGAPVSDDVVAFLSHHTLGRQAALRRGFAAAPQSLQ